MAKCTQGNLGDRACTRVVRFGVLMGGVTVALGLLAVEVGYATRFGWLLAVPLSAAAYFIMSGVSGVCIYAGLRGQRMQDHGTEAVLDSDQAARLRMKALAVVTLSLLIGSGFAAFVASA